MTRTSSTSSIGELTDKLALAEINWEQAKQYLEDQQTKWDLITKCVKIGVWDWRMKTATQKEELIWDNNMHELFGTNPITWGGTYADFNKCLVEDDSLRVAALIQYCIEHHTLYEYSFKLKSRPGILIRGKGQCFYDKDNLPYRFIGICMEDNEIIFEKDKFIKDDKFNVESYVSALLAQS
jgi:hypothetical protein